MVVDAAGEIARLQNLLKGSRGGAPKPEIVAVALAMARDPKLDRTKALSALSRGGSRTRAVEYCNRIVDENLLDCEQSVPAADPFGGLPATMHVQRTWITEHAAGLHDLSVGALALSSDGRAAGLFMITVICDYMIMITAFSDMITSDYSSCEKRDYNHLITTILPRGAMA